MIDLLSTYNCLVMIQRQVNTQDADGAPVETYQTIAQGVPACISTLNVQTAILYGADRANQFARFEMQWSVPVYEGDRLICNGRVYIIKGINRVFESMELGYERLQIDAQWQYNIPSYASNLEAIGGDPS